ncbi:MAG: hypothetical protein EBQ51_02225 [Verrucomicrobia bacterium]|nr:hypothetical protein [Pseudomonadota bacterium]NBS05888.1 hypothetical protein [Verrucomicrobiota bacterium]NBT23317.1 hypothetical protein [bacterium]NBS49545.1 hypothetical protein [Verrucomicrobiota bacterium]NBV96171.1 hypothetical protein [Verrucomicrobiota bacterium]
MLRGARQGGKTRLVERFLAQRFESFVKIVFHSGRMELMSKLHQVISRKSNKALLFMRGLDPFWTGQSESKQFTSL